MKLLAKIPKDAEAVIVLVGKLLEKVVCRIIFLCVLLSSNVLMRHSSFVFKYQSALSCRCFTIHAKHDRNSACNNVAPTCINRGGLPLFLLGCVDFLEQLAMAFVRLDEAVLLESVLEIPVPVRFIFILLGPSQSSVDYHEIGRSFATLMSDKVALVPPG